MSYYKRIDNVTWYYYLNPKEKIKGLFSDYQRTSLANKFTVCWDYMNGDKNIRLYSVFKSYLDFVIYFLKTEKQYRCFYEIVLGEHLQKPHFDLDMETDFEKSETVLSDLCNSICSVLKEKNITLNLSKDVCIYASHGKHKKSYHIIINNYCHHNNKDAKAFYYEVMKRLPKEYFEKKWIDLSVYSKTQQFRTFGSTKFGSERYKTVISEWNYMGQKIKHKLSETPDSENHQFLLQFEESIVSARVSTCKMLPAFEIPDEFQKKTNYEEGYIDENLAMAAIRLLAEKVHANMNDVKFPYRFDRLENSFVLLKRVKPSKCRVCQRIHHNENPYIMITPETKHVFFHCRRAAPDKSWYIGCLKGDDDSDEKPAPKVWNIDAVERLNNVASKGIEVKTKRTKKVENNQMILESVMRQKMIN